MNDSLRYLEDAASDRARRGLNRRLISRGAAPLGHIFVDCRKCIHFGSNDYLGLAADPRVVAAATEATFRYGWGAGASALVSGWSDAHQGLAAALAVFEEVDAVALFPTGFASNLGTISALVGPGDAVYLDRLDHASIVAGARLSGARLRVYPHADATRLNAILTRDSGRFRHRLIATDGVFSMDGDLAPLAAIAAIAERHDAVLLVDEAHATGVVGPDGRGAAALLDVERNVHVRVGTLSKALGSLGGFVAGSTRLIHHIMNHAGSLIYSTSTPPAAAAAAHAALNVARSEPALRSRLEAHGRRLRERLREAGLAIPESAAPIIPITLGEPELALDAARRLAERGFFVPAIRPPTVPAGTARLRVSLSAAHDVDQIDALAEAIVDLFRANAI